MGDEDNIVGTKLDSVTVNAPLTDDSQEIVVESEVEGEKHPTANSSFSEATDEDRLLDEELERDSLDDENEVMVLEDSSGE